MSDYRQQEEAQQEHEAAALQALVVVREKCGDGTASILASTLGLYDEYRQRTKEQS